ncbi:17.3 kDa class I heat shock protein-like [Curcuma longa]|uniref:17.3 kDa class I heat shock protein-like n=1 Tax=Curcuma longa TaxID=136217 RepID=UPI003D9EC84A
MSNTPFGFGSRPSNRLDPFFDDSFGSGSRRSRPLDPLYPDPSYSDLSYAVVEDARVDWKETCAARVSKADLPGRRKRGANVEVEASAVQISGQRTCKREKKTDTRLNVEREKTTETWHRVEREKTTETWHRVEREKKTETWHSLELEKNTDTRHHVAREKKTDTRHHAARGKKTDSGEVLRRFRLPANVKADQVKVAMKDRMLTVTVPKEVAKKPVKKPSGKSIKISG